MEKKQYILAGSLIDGTGGAVRKNVLLTINHGVITAIGSSAELPQVVGTAVNDFSHCTIVPALVDSSISLSRSPSLGSSTSSLPNTAGLPDTKGLAERHISYCHSHGVLGMAVNDSLPGPEDVFLKAAAEGRLVEIRSAGSDFLRISYSSDIDMKKDPSPLLRPDDLRRILTHGKNKKSVVVANGPQQVREALAAGCAAIEQGYGMGEDNLRRMADTNVLWIPNVLRAKNGRDGSLSGGDICCRFSTRYVAPGKPVPGAEAYWSRILAEQLALLGLAGKLGIKTAVGTGAGQAGILHGESMAEEMKLFIKAGFSLAETLCCASETGAAFFNMERLGALTVGQRATFLITRGTPQQLPRKLSYLEGIFINGLPSLNYTKNPTRAA